MSETTGESSTTLGAPVRIAPCRSSNRGAPGPQRPLECSLTACRPARCCGRVFLNAPRDPAARLANRICSRASPRPRPAHRICSTGCSPRGSECHYSAWPAKKSRCRPLSLFLSKTAGLGAEKSQLQNLVGEPRVQPVSPVIAQTLENACYLNRLSRRGCSLLIPR